MPLAVPRVAVVYAQPGEYTMFPHTGEPEPVDVNGVEPTSYLPPGLLPWTLIVTGGVLAGLPSLKYAWPQLDSHAGDQYSLISPIVAPDESTIGALPATESPMSQPVT